MKAPGVAARGASAETFSAISATLMRHNAISNTLSTKPDNFKPLLLRSRNGELDPRL